jgi:uncharacterized protein (TIGR02147 family)
MTICYYYSMLNKNLPNIYRYNDFRKFLDDYQRARSRLDGSFSRSGICRRLGLPKSRSYFNDIVKGKPITSTYIDRFIHAFEMDKDEAQFFRALVKFNQATETGERELFFDQLVLLNKAPRAIIDISMYEYYREWRHSVIRALLDTFDFRGDYGRLARMVNPPISKKQARESVALLLKLKLIEKNDHGAYKPTDKVITTDPYVKDELVKQYQAKCIEIAAKALLNKGMQFQNFSTNLISISETGMHRMEKSLQKFKSEIRSVIHKDELPADRIYQLNVQLFPVAKQIGQKKRYARD